MQSKRPTFEDLLLAQHTELAESLDVFTKIEDAAVVLIYRIIAKGPCGYSHNGITHCLNVPMSAKMASPNSEFFSSIDL